MATTQIRAAGYPVRMPFMEFALQYGVLQMKKDAGNFSDKNAKKVCEEIVAAAKLERVAFGTTKIFLRLEHAEGLEKRLFAMQKHATALTAVARGFLCRKRIPKLKAAGVLLGLGAERGGCGFSQLPTTYQPKRGRWPGSRQHRRQRQRLLSWRQRQQLQLQPRPEKSPTAPARPRLRPLLEPSRKLRAEGRAALPACPRCEWGRY
jgi:hypothetical protein